MLHVRAQLFADIRQFFLARGVLEVETPVLSQSSGTDPMLDFFTADYFAPPLQQRLFLQTSPEFAMKRLLAAGSGPIYQIAKAFRNGEAGRFHNPEFTMLEWYQLDYRLPQLMDEIDELMAVLFQRHWPLAASQRISYQDAFQRYTGLDALTFSYQDYSRYALASHLPDAISLCGNDHGLWLDFLFSHKVQPQLGEGAVCMVYGYPSCQSSLARVSGLNPLTTERVEVFINGIELGNGYYELTDAKEQDSRFDKEITIREQQNRPLVAKDYQLLAAMEAGLPECSGMAIGLDRLLMVMTQSASIDDVLSFPLHRA